MATDLATVMDTKEMGGLECPHSMSEHLSPQPFSDDEPKPSPSLPKTADYLYAFRGTFDRELHGVCWVRVFEEEGHTPIMASAKMSATWVLASA